MNNQSINATAKQNIIEANDDKRDLVIANHKHIYGGKGGAEFTQAMTWERVSDWYLSNCNMSDRILIPIYSIQAVLPDEGSMRTKVNVANKTLKYYDYSKIQRIRELWSAVYPVLVTTAGPDVGRGINLQNWLSDEDIMFSVWFYAYENGVVCDSFETVFPAHGKNMTRGLFYLRMEEIAIYKPSGYYEIHYAGRIYSIHSGKGYGEPCVGQSLLQEVAQNQEQNIGYDDSEYEFEYPQRQFNYVIVIVGKRLIL